MPPDPTWSSLTRSGDVPPTTRLIAGMGAALGIAYGSVAVQALLDRPEPLPATAAVLVVAALPAVLVFAAIAAAPRLSRETLLEHTGADLADPLHALAVGLTVVTLFVVFGLGSLVETAFGLENVFVHGKTISELTDFTEAGILRSVGMNLLVFLLPPLAWTAWVDGDALPDLQDRLGLWVRDGLAGAGWGVGLVVASFLVLGLLAGAFHLLGVEPPDNERALALGRALTLPSALAVASAAALGEELFFRGWLQTKIGNVPQAILFGVAHFSYLHVLQGLVTLALGYGFGVARERTDSLLAPMLAHFGFNALTFLAILYG